MVLLAIIVSTTCVVVVLVKRRSKQQPTGIQENDGMGGKKYNERECHFIFIFHVVTYF